MDFHHHNLIQETDNFIALVTMTGEIRSKEGVPIEEGDHVYTKIRGGRHEGEVKEEGTLHSVMN